MKALLILALGAFPAFAQLHNLQVYSEFTRIDPFGNILPQDKGATEPRHILSPGVPRNAFSSLRIAVTIDKPTKYILDIGQNPENAVKATLYKERFRKQGEQWIPDALEPVRIPYEANFPEADSIPGQTTVTFWLDMWVDRNSPDYRIKVEPQAWIGYADDWFTYPMEARILAAVIPNQKPSNAALPDDTLRSDEAAIGPLRALFCGVKEQAGEGGVNARAFIRRNALQFTSLNKTNVAAKLLRASKATDIPTWCKTDPKMSAGPEWFLRFRDSLVQGPGQ